MAISHQQVYENIATMLNAGVDLKKILHTSANGAARELHDAIVSVEKSVGKGGTLNRAFSRYPKIFPAFDRALIDAGEKAGRLPEIFLSLADWYRLKTRMMLIIKSGLIRPFFTLTAAAFIMPFPMIMASMSKYIFSVTLLLMVFYLPPVTLVILYRKLHEHGSFRVFLEKFLLKIPVAGKAVRNLTLGRYCFGFRMLLESGISIDKCAQIAADMCGNSVISDMVAGGKISAQQGNPVSSGFSRELPDDFLSIWKVGEESGRLGETIKKLHEKMLEKAEYNFIELSRWIPRLVSALVALFFIWYILKSWNVFGPGI
ncbi:MAG: type II secretion system F family protein [Desulfobacteraceae bacterium]